jgi:hypothetical protein
MKFEVASALFWASVALGLGSSSATAVSTGADAWESFPPANLRDCKSIDRSLIIPVPATQRSEAIARLKNTSFVKLTRPQAVALVGRQASVPAGRGLRPFLVRAVAKYEGTGAFEADMCGTSLPIVHGSLGHSTPPSIRAPIVVFLPNLPAKVYVSWQMAE